MSGKDTVRGMTDHTPLPPSAGALTVTTRDRATRPRVAVTVRAARVEDVEALTILCNLPGFRHGTLQIPFKRAAEGRRWIEGLDEYETAVVAEVEGRIVGSAGLHRQKGRRLHAAGLGMGVHDDFTGRGVGTALLAALLDAADNWLDIRRVELSVFTDNAPAIALYRRFGFETEGVARAYAFRDGAYADTMMMARLRRV
jgi:putative acetyltransferase